MVYVIVVLSVDSGVLVFLFFVWLEGFGFWLNYEEGMC